MKSYLKDIIRLSRESKNNQKLFSIYRQSFRPIIFYSCPIWKQILTKLALENELDIMFSNSHCTYIIKTPRIFVFIIAFVSISIIKTLLWNVGTNNYQNSETKLDKAQFSVTFAILNLSKKIPKLMKHI